jgi:hypothetical protein
VAPKITLSKPRIAKQNGRPDFVIDSRGIRHRIIRLAIPGSKDQLWNFAYVAWKLGIPIETVEARQRGGWFGHGTLRVFLRRAPEPDSLGRVRKMRFLLARHVKAAVAEKKGPRLLTQEKAAFALLGHGPNQRFKAVCDELDLVPQAKRSRVGRPGLGFVASEVRAAKKELDARSEAALSVDFRPGKFLRQFLREITKAKRGKTASGAEWGMAMSWIETGCRYLDGERLRAEPQGGRREWVVDKEDAKRILSGIRLELKGKVHPGRKLLTKVEGWREYRLSRNLLQRREQSGELRSIKKMGLKFYGRKQLKKIAAERDGTFDGGDPSNRRLTLRQAAEFFGVAVALLRDAVRRKALKTVGDKEARPIKRKRKAQRNEPENGRKAKEGRGTKVWWIKQHVVMEDDVENYLASLDERPPTGWIFHVGIVRMLPPPRSFRAVSELHRQLSEARRAGKIEFKPWPHKGQHFIYEKKSSQRWIEKVACRRGAKRGPKAVNEERDKELADLLEKLRVWSKVIEAYNRAHKDLPQGKLLKNDRHGRLRVRAAVIRRLGNARVRELLGD